MKKLLICFLTITMLLAFAGCSLANDDGEIISGADGKPAVIVSDNNNTTQPTEQITQTTTETTQATTAPIINISEEQAKEIAFKRLKEDYSVNGAKAIGLGCDYTDFEFDKIELIYYGEGGYYDTFDVVKEKGHSYYLVEYKNTTQLCDFAYFLVDAADGEILFSGYMGD